MIFNFVFASYFNLQILFTCYILEAHKAKWLSPAYHFSDNPMETNSSENLLNNHISYSVSAYQPYMNNFDAFTTQGAVRQPVNNKTVSSCSAGQLSSHK